MTLILSGDITLRRTWQPMDPDAAAYISAVEAADAAAGSPGGLEEKVKIAIDNFVLGCKADGIWNAIKASCILAGARTLNGALVPLVGAGPSKFGTEGNWSYNRKTGLRGDGSTNYLNSNRNNNADPQDSKHLAVWHSTPASVNGGLLGSDDTSAGHSHLYTGFGNFITRNNAATDSSQSLTASPSTTFYGTSRASPFNFTIRHGALNYTAQVTSQVPADANILVYRTVGTSDARLAFYSIGESLDLALLDARVTDLINKFAEVIP